MKNLLVFALLFAALPVFAAPVKVNLSEAIKMHMVQVEAVATGQSYMARGLRLKLSNKGGTAIELKIDQGVIFKPADEEYQPLVCAGEETITLQPFKDGQADVQTFCADAGESAPVQALSYNFSHKAGDTLLKLLQYIKTNNLFNELGQKAVWTITNNHSLTTVYEASYDKQAEKLTDYLSGITGRSKPDYYVGTALNQTPGAAVYTPKPLKMYAKFEQILTEPKKLTLGIFDDKGKMVQEVFSNRPFGKAGHRFTVTFESSDVPAGKYYIRLKEGDAVLQEKVVEVL